MSRLALAWERFWFRPAEPGNLIAARVLLAGSALWILLSRPGLPDLLSWPAAFRAGFDPAVTWRFLHFGQPAWAEKALFVVLLLCLACVLAGLWTRWAAVCSALLLYHFAPLMDPLHTRGGPYFLGLTVPLLGMLFLSFGQSPGRGSPPSPEWRWPLAAIQTCFVAIYVLSGIAKLWSAGPAWATAANFEGLVLGQSSPESTPVWAHLFVGHPALCAAGAAGGLLFDFVLPPALLFPRTAPWAIAALLAAHLAIALTFGVYFIGAPGLLLFVDWSSLGRRRSARASGPAPPARP